MTIVADAAYRNASRRTARKIARIVRRRFREVLGTKGNAMLHSMEVRMISNARSDGRTELDNGKR